MYGLDLETEGRGATEGAAGYHKADDLSSRSLTGGLVMAGVIVGIGVLADTAYARDWRQYGGGNDNGGGAGGNQSDHDGDGLFDREETEIYGTCPGNPDSDGDGLLDGQEVKVYNTNPLAKDTDGDRLWDGEEVRNYNTDPLRFDTDNDGLFDGEEVHQYRTNPRWADTDRDGFDDGEEVWADSNPRNPHSVPHARPRPMPHTPYHDWRFNGHHTNRPNNIYEQVWRNRHRNDFRRR